MFRPALALLLVLAGTSADAQSVIKGKVVRTDSAGIAGARVQVTDSARSNTYTAVTDTAGELTVRLTMAVDAIPLQPLHVTARDRYIRSPLDEFYDRAERVRRFGGGVIIGYEEAQRRRGTNLQLVIDERVPAARSCPPSVFIDGMLARTEDVRAVSMTDVEGIEIYRTQTMVPARYQGRTTCGAVLIWTQVGDRAEGTRLTWRRVFMALGILSLGYLLLK
jgi:hypothetical protein